MRRSLDAELVRRGLAPDRAQARAAIAEGLVLVDGTVPSSAQTRVAPHQAVRIVDATLDGFVSRGGAKLDGGLARFGIEVAGADALDAGASTGGFTDCLLRRGAARVIAVDVGYGDLAWRLRTDPRVTVFERTNVRELDRRHLPFSPSVVVADLSFTSLAAQLPSLVRVADPAATFVVLVKPQFELPRGQVGGGGVVREPEGWSAALERVSFAFETEGVGTRGIVPSPIRGRAGNVEFLLWAERGAEGAASPTDLERAVAEAQASGATL